MSTIKQFLAESKTGEHESHFFYHVRQYMKHEAAGNDDRASFHLNAIEIRHGKKAADQVPHIEDNDREIRKTYQNYSKT